MGDTEKKKKVLHWKAMDFAEKFYVPTGLSYSSQYQDQNNNLDDVVKVFF